MHFIMNTNNLAGFVSLYAENSYFSHECAHVHTCSRQYVQALTCGEPHEGMSLAAKEDHQMD